LPVVYGIAAIAADLNRNVIYFRGEDIDEQFVALVVDCVY